MTKEQMLASLERYEDDEVIDEYDRFIEELEERQHASGFYVQQDIIEMYRREW